MNILTPQQANNLIRIRDHWINKKIDCGETEDINNLLDIIDTLQFDRDTDVKPKITGWSVILRGRYVHSTNKSPICLYFVVVMDTYDEEAIIGEIQKQYSGRNNLLDGFEIIAHEMYDATDRVILTGTGMGG